MTKYVLIGVLSILAFLLIACTTQEVSDRPLEEDLIAAEAGAVAVAGQAINAKIQISYVKCKDTDGNDPYTKGTITGSYRINGRLKNYRDTDSCWNNNEYVVEFICVDDKKPEKVMVLCPAGCKNGACVPVECTDSDGNDLSTRGTTTGLNSDRTAIITTQDYCAETVTGPQTESGSLFVVEGQCLPDGRNNGFHTVCPEGQTCQDGACVTSQEVPGCTKDFSGYPCYFRVSGYPNRFGDYMVVGERAPTQDNLAVTDISFALQNAGMVVENAVRLDTELANISLANVRLISVGNACVNQVTANLLQLPPGTSCTSGLTPGQVKLKVIEQSSGKVALLIYGYRGEDDRLGANILAHNRSQLSGREVSCTGAWPSWQNATCVTIG